MKPPSDLPVRHRLLVAYRGTRFAGWQRQDGQPHVATVQGVLEIAVAQLVGSAVTAVAAGRTDAGVHARGQVVHVDLPRVWPDGALVHGSNHFLPDDIRVLAARPAEPGFDARRSADAKLYRYRLMRAAVVSPLDAPFAVRADLRLDVAAMVAATAELVGRHDFRAFALAGGSHEGGGPQATVRSVYEASWEDDPATGRLDLSIRGEGFLRGMVRGLVGTLLEIGMARRSGANLIALLAGAPRGQAGPTAPSHGLCLERVDYPHPHLWGPLS